MSAFIPPWSSRYSGGVPHETPASQLRVSDAERSEVSEVLSKHYAEGRLDEAELNERLQKAMSARTRGDLSGLLVDLPSLAPALPEAPVRRRGGRFALSLLVVVMFLAALSSPVWSWHFPWLFIAIVFFVVWRLSHRRRNRLHHPYGGGGRWGGPGTHQAPYGSTQRGSCGGSWV